LIVEKDASEVVPANEITVLVPYGSLFFATASLMEEQFPEVTEDTRHSVVILQLIQDEDLGSTFLKVIERFATDLNEHDSKLMLSGVSERAKRQLNRTGLTGILGTSNIYLKTEKIGESITDAWYAGQEWIADASKGNFDNTDRLPLNAERFGLDERIEP
jgi:SulP family sulfate permease